MIQGKDAGYYPGTQMTASGGDWFVYVFKDAAPGAKDGFKFVDYVPGSGNQYSNGATYDNSGADFTMGNVFLTQGSTEVWIIPQGTGKPPIITDVPPASKAVYLFNPWPETAPAIHAGAGADPVYTTMRLSPDKQRCGWYVHYFTSADYKVSFRSLIGNETYGLSGLGAAGQAKPIDLSAFFATGDTVYLLPDPIPGGPPKILAAFPAGVAGTCSFPLAVTIRDFSAKHPDFEEDGMGGNLTKNMVQPILPADKKPVQGTAFYYQKYFDKWFRTDSANADPNLRNYETCRDLPMSKDKYGYWGYDSFDSPAHGYFPIDDFNRFNETYVSHYRDPATGKYVDGTAHNFHFCMEMHANFKYRQGQVFKFSGDDDVWVYIDNKLSIDLGGTHGPEADSVALDKQGLVAGNKYDFDLFYCERKTRGSNLLIQTSIFFEQNQSVFAKRLALGSGKDQYDIFEIISGDQSCGSAKDGDTVAAKTIFRLSGPSVNPPQDLPAGLTYGGITVNAGKTQVLVDTAKITGLRPGLYTVTYASERSGKGGTLQFTVGGSLDLEFAAKPPVHVLLGTAVPVLVHAVLNGIADKRAEPFRLAPQSGLLVFADSGLTVPIAAGSDLATDAATGEKRIWVTSMLPSTYNLDLLGGPSKSVVMDSYGNLAFFEPPKPPIAVAKAWYLDLDGDGRIETAMVRFAADLPVVPDRMGFKIADQAGRTAGFAPLAVGGIVFSAGSKSLIRATFPEPFAFGITSLTNGADAGTLFAQGDIPLVDGSFAVEDSAAPVIFAAEVREPDNTQPLKRLVITFSENMAMPPDVSQMLAFKRDGLELAAGQVLISRVERIGDRQYSFYVDSTSQVFPIVGDSVAINNNGQTRDLAGNTPAKRIYRKLEGIVPKGPPTDLFVTFPNGSKADPSTGSEPVSQPSVLFIPVGRDGNALPGAGIGKCGTCPAQGNGVFVGPIFHISTPGPMDYDFKIFSNLGEFVAGGRGRIEKEDLPLLEKTNGASGILYRVRVVWTGRTATGGKAGTGAYILTAILRPDRDLKTGAQPVVETRKITFGLLRGFKG
jgi:fibro-slime domain-containing protein